MPRRARKTMSPTWRRAFALGLVPVGVYPLIVTLLFVVDYMLGDQSMLHEWRNGSTRRFVFGFLHDWAYALPWSYLVALPWMLTVRPGPRVPWLTATMTAAIAALAAAWIAGSPAAVAVAAYAAAGAIAGFALASAAGNTARRKR